MHPTLPPLCYFISPLGVIALSPSTFAMLLSHKVPGPKEIPSRQEPWQADKPQEDKYINRTVCCLLHYCCCLEPEDILSQWEEVLSVLTTQIRDYSLPPPVIRSVSPAMKPP